MPKHPTFDEESGTWERVWDDDPDLKRHGAVMELQWLAEPDKRLTTGYTDGGVMMLRALQSRSGRGELVARESLIRAARGA